MVRTLNKEQHLAVLDWAERFRENELPDQSYNPLTPSGLLEVENLVLKNYFRLCALARSKTAVQEFSQRADKHLFRIRKIIEDRLQDLIRNTKATLLPRLNNLKANRFYGVSKKQGVSVRMPLNTCRPTSLCAGGCYAHDVLDATPQAVIRGAINGFIAASYEQGSLTTQSEILEILEPATRRAIKAAHRELDFLPEGFHRRPYIRFSHVGEIVAFPKFANALAHQVASCSDREVDCIAYTRHPKAKELDESLWIINFTLDPVSAERQAWAPKSSRIVYSAFGGVLSSVAEVNFLEHHRHIHLDIKSGEGDVCPATLPICETRTCDACRCNTCFVKPSRS